MSSPNTIDSDTILDAASELLRNVGLQRVTMADVARKAGVSRATLYRRFGSVREVIAALATREWSAIVRQTPFATMGHPVRPLLVDAIVKLVGQIRVHPLLRNIIDLDPNFLLPYLLHRKGTNANQQLEMLHAALKIGHADGSIRDDDVHMQANAVLLNAWSFTLTGPVLVSEHDGAGPQLEALDAQLKHLLDRYLAP